MVKDQLTIDLKQAISDLGYEVDDAVLYLPPDLKLADYTSNIALQLAKQNLENSKQSPVDIANKISEKLSELEYLEKIDVVGPGFLNFFIKPEYLAENIAEIIHQGANFGNAATSKNQKIQVEFISANPTGPLTLANGRGGAIGDTLANVMQAAGYQIEREYYVNDTGNQVRVLADSVKAAGGKIDPEENHYQGEYVKELAEKFKDKLDLPSLELGHLLADYFMENEIKPAIKNLGINYDVFYSERTLHQVSVPKVLELMQEKGLTYEKGGAIWFKSTDYGDEKDRVLMTSDAERGRQDPTYFLADIAHHYQILSGDFAKRINILGADHHGYERRIQGAMTALGFKDKLDVIFMQFVRLYKDGQEVRMSKRAGTYVTLDELLQALGGGQKGADVARFFFLMYGADSHINFNLDLAQKQSNENPVYYVQYAHARMSSIQAKAEMAHSLDHLHQLIHPAERALILHLSELPTLLEELARSYQVQHLTTYAIKLADMFHKFYELCRVLDPENPELSQSRLALVKASQQVLQNSLKMLGVSAPSQM